MSLRKFMHPRNKYKQEPDFKSLAIIYPDFCKHTTTDLAGRVHYNFKNKESLKVLAKILLKHDFDLDVDIPDDKLIPALPLRLNYILWIEDLVDHAKLSQFGDIHGIDIGTGAICVYPLLCAKMYGWKMTGTDISETSVLSAENNIKRNLLDHLIQVISVKEKTVVSEVCNDARSYSFTMCNPPFFDLDQTSRKEKRLPPRNAATGNETELATEGGEKSFVRSLIDESEILGDRVKIYTTMLGHRSNCAHFRSELKRRNIENTTWTEFCQGYTKRWGLAWSFLSKDIFDLTKAPVIRTRDLCQEKTPSKDNSSELVFSLGNKFQSVDELIVTLKTWIRELKIEMKDLDVASEEFEGWTCFLKAYEDSWSHARRKRRLAQRLEQSAKKLCLENAESSSGITSCTEDSEVSLEVRETSPYLECTFLVGKMESDEEDEEETLVKICTLYLGGSGGKSALETFRQYLINKLNIREYFLNKSPHKAARKKKRKGKRIERESDQ